MSWSRTHTGSKKVLIHRGSSFRHLRNTENLRVEIISTRTIHADLSWLIAAFNGVGLQTEVLDARVIDF
jgi:hypothetical protein